MEHRLINKTVDEFHVAPFGPNEGTNSKEIRHERGAPRIFAQFMVGSL